MGPVRTWSGVSAGEVVGEVAEVGEVVGEVAEVVGEVAEVVGEVVEVPDTGVVTSLRVVALTMRASSRPTVVWPWPHTALPCRSRSASLAQRG